MSRLASRTCRLATAVLAGLVSLAVLRWGPVYARPGLDVRALPLALPLVAAAVLAALTGLSRPAPLGMRRVALGLGCAAAALGLVVGLRPSAGLVAEVTSRGVWLGSLPPGPVDVAGPELAGLPAPRQRTIRWDGELRAPESGTYRLRAVGRGSVTVAVDGIALIEAPGESLASEVDVPIGRGAHRLEVTLERRGPGPRLRLEWVPPGRSREFFGGTETIPPRVLGDPAPGWLWRLTDLLAAVVAALLGVLVFLVPWEARRALPTPWPVTRRETLWTAGFLALAVAAMSWPMVLDLAGRGPMQSPDGRLNAWILAWDVHALLHEPARLFQAPIFHPLPDALAFSENLLLPAVLVSPALIWGGPLLGYNLALLGSFVVSGLGVYLLVRRASGDRGAAFVAGALFAVGAHRWIRLSHLHAEVTLFLPFVLLALDRFWERRTLWRGMTVGLLVAAQGLSSVYLGAITATAVALATGVALVGGLRLRELVRLAAGLALGALLVAPLVRPYLRMRDFQGMEFTLDDLRVYSTTLESYAASGTPLWGPVSQRQLDPDRVHDGLFPGLVPLVLGLAGLAVAPRRYRTVGVVISVAAVVLSLGPETAPYRFLHEHVVLFRGIRALSRFSLLPVLVLCVGTGLALSGARGWRALALVLALLEARHAPLELAPAVEPSAASRWLAGREGAVAWLPLGAGDTTVMLEGVAHWRPLINGDSGFIPRPYDRTLELLEKGATPEAQRYLRAVGVTHVVSGAAEPLPEAARFDGDGVAAFVVPPGESAGVVTGGTEVAGLWSAHGVVADAGEVRLVDRVAFELADGPWVAAPHVSVSEDGVSWRDVPASASLADATLSLARDPRHGRGEVRFDPVPARLVRLPPGVPARPGRLWTGP